MFDKVHDGDSFEIEEYFKKLFSVKIILLKRFIGSQTMHRKITTFSKNTFDNLPVCSAQSLNDCFRGFFNTLFKISSSGS